MHTQTHKRNTYFQLLTTTDYQLCNDVIVTIMLFIMWINFIVSISARLTMGNICASNQLRIQTLHDIGLGYRRIASKFPVDWAFCCNTDDWFDLRLLFLQFLNKGKIVFENVCISLNYLCINFTDMFSRTFALNVQTCIMSKVLK